MVILGINSSHNATACLIKDGKILACISEERLTGIKNYWGMPYLSIKECLKISNLKESDIDFLVLNYLDPKIHAGFSAFKTERGKVTKSKPGESLAQQVAGYLWKIKEYVLTKFPNSKYIYDFSLKSFYRYSLIDAKLDKKIKKEISYKVNIPHTKILKIDHHTTHGLSAYYSSHFPKKEPILIFTLDSSGDGVSATVSMGTGDKFEKIAQTPSGSSISDLYMHTTAYLGMKSLEHEHKVMGLAAYLKEDYIQPLLHKLKELAWVNSDLTFGTKIDSSMFYKLLPKLYEYERFDNIAAAVQVFTEQLVCEWIKKATGKTGVSNIVCAGGTFMNVKVNQRISELKEVKKMFIMPSASDESTAIGAAYGGYQLKRDENPNLPEIQPLTHLYLGRNFNDQYTERILKKNKKFTISKPPNLEEKIATFLAKGEIVARLSGRSEWGARALGNRSILAHPSKLEVIPEINKQIKSRDFWMPFAPSILEEDQERYFINRKHISSPYMIIAFDSTLQGQKDLKSAMHQYDYTLRPQVVYKKWNPSYHKVIKEFKKLTGIGGVLNTSFNLHGFPIVYSPQDALFVFENSGLKFLAIGPYLVSKKEI